MTQSSLHRPIGKGIVFGAIGGFVGGLVMYAIMSGGFLCCTSARHQYQLCISTNNEICIESRPICTRGHKSVLFLC